MIDEILSAVSDFILPRVQRFDYYLGAQVQKIAIPTEKFIKNNIAPILQKHVAPPVGRALDRLELTVNDIDMRMTNIQHTWNYNMGRWESGEPITNAVETFIAGAISEMQDRLHTKYLDMADVALSESWEAFNKAAEAFDNSNEHKLIELGDRAITQAGIDFTDWGDEVVRVKDPRGRDHNISLTELIGD